jgi:hypothetical protein
LTEALEEYERLSKNNNGSSFRKMAMKTETDSRVEKIKNLLDLMNKDKHKKQLIKDKRNGQPNSSNMEEPISNPGRGDQHDLQEGTGREDLPETNEDL